MRDTLNAPYAGNLFRELSLCLELCHRGSAAEIRNMGLRVDAGDVRRLRKLILLLHHVTVRLYSLALSQTHPDTASSATIRSGHSHPFHVR